MSHEENVASLGPGWEKTVSRFMPNADLAFGVLGTELWSRQGARLGWKALRRLGRRGLVEFTGSMLASCRDWTAETFENERVHGLFAPWVLHTGLGPDAASSGFMAQVIGVALELGGMPVPRGGGVKLVEALRGVSRAVNEAERGLLPVEATVVVGQPMAVDPSRAPDGSWILWIQLQEIPSELRGDAAGELDVGRGTWTKGLREAYADRIQA